MYLALYRKYRPKTFEDVISQEHITTTLKNQLKNGQNAHAYLFTGSRGTGKTTCAKILAKALNCLNPVDGNPCLECEACRSIDAEGSDVTEIDAASNNGVDYVRELKEEAVYAPITCKYRVYIIDEVHMLSTAAFNALLKLIEEPPPHVIFIFATTENHKVPATILSRCQRFEFRRIDINESKKRLIEISEKENVRLSDEAAFLISKISDGGMRDALSLLDQCLSVSNEITAEVVRECAGISGSDYLFEITDRIEENNVTAVLKLIDELVSCSKNIGRLLEELIGHYRLLMLLSAGADNSVTKISESELPLYKKQTEKYTLEEIMRCISVLSEFLSSMNRATNPVLHAEMCMIRLCTPKLDSGERALSIRIDQLEKLLNNTIRNIKSGAVAAENTFLPENPDVYYPAEEIIPEAENTEYIPPVYEEAVPENSSYNEEQPFEIKLPFEEAPVEKEAIEEKISEAPKKEETLAEAIEAVKEQKKEAALAPSVNITEEEDFGDYKILEEWNEIIETIPFSVRILISDTTAKIKGNTVLIEGGELCVGYATGDFRQDVQTAVSKALGRNITIVGKKSEKKEEDIDRKVNDFLDFARSQGVNIKEQ